MKKYYIASPQVAGELGPNTKFISRAPLRVDSVEYLFNVWPSDTLLEAYPCFIIRQDLQLVIQNSGLTGAVFGECLTGFTDYVDAADRTSIPKFARLDPHGVLGVDDFCMSPTQKLLVSERAKTILSDFTLDCEYRPLV